MRVRIDIATRDADWLEGRIPGGLSKIVRSKAEHQQLEILVNQLKEACYSD